MLRKHQAQYQDTTDAIVSGSGVTDVLMSVTPGGGKSSIPIITGKLKQAGLIDGLAWVVPRQALQDQGERGFLDPFFRELFDHNLTIRSATNDVNPCRGTDGFVTTYQALGVDDKGVVAEEFRRRRYALLLDEFHHVEDGGIWHQAIEPLYRNAAFRIRMTGTLERGDGNPIAFVKYRNNQPDLKGDESTSVITYTRRDALAEKAILPISFHLSDGRFQWEDKEGTLRDINSFSQAEPKERAAALYTALQTDFARELLWEGVSHWRGHQQQNPRAKMLVVTANYDQAKEILEFLRKEGFNAEIATSHHSKAAVQAIKRFKALKTDILVTIAMAYEGLDVPPVTHISSLTHVRSTPWIEQMVARGVRIDRAAGPYESQRCYVFAPKDHRMVAVMKQIKEEQTPTLGKKSGPGESEFERIAFPGEGGGGTQGPDINPLGSSLTGLSQHFVGLDGTPPDAPVLIETVSEKEQRLRRRIAGHVNRYAFDNHYEPQRINSELKKRFDKARDDMELSELEALMFYLEINYPVGVTRFNAPVPNEIVPSRPRARRKRLSTKSVQLPPREDGWELYM